MLRRLALFGLLAVVLAQPASALGFKVRVTTNNSFVLAIQIFGSVQVSLDAAWGKRATDLDWLVQCEDGQGGEVVVAQGLSTEPRLEDLSFGVADVTGNGISCTATLFKISGPATGGFANFRATGTELSAGPSPVARPARVAVNDVPGLRGEIERRRAAKLSRPPAN